MCQYTNKKVDRKANKRLDLIHCDLAVPIQPTSINESEYAIIFVDDFSGLIVVYCVTDGNCYQNFILISQNKNYFCI